MKGSKASFEGSVELVDLAREMLSRRINLLEGVRRISALRLDTDDPNNEVFHQLIAIDDETDHFPLGEIRSRWSAEALRRVDREMEHYLTDAEGDILRACEEIVRRFSPTS